MDIKSTIRDFLTKHSKCEKDSPLVLIWELGGFSRILVKNAKVNIKRAYNKYHKKSQE